MVRAYTYIRMHGPDGLRKISEYAVLNANYLMALLRKTYHLPYDRVCMHEFVLEGHVGGCPGCPCPGYCQADDGLSTCTRRPTTSR